QQVLRILAMPKAEGTSAGVERQRSGVGEYKAEVTDEPRRFGLAHAIDYVDHSYDAAAVQTAPLRRRVEYPVRVDVAIFPEGLPGIELFWISLLARMYQHGASVV